MGELQMNNKVYIRVFNEERDFEAVDKLENNCEMGTKKGLSTFTNLMGDPFRRIRLYPVRVTLVAELLQNGELVGVVRGCIKSVGITGLGRAQHHVRMGCILGLRVSPSHRRMGIGLRLMESLEDWLIRNGANYCFLATEENNIASKGLFTLKCKYIEFSSLVIYAQTLKSTARDNPSSDIRVERLCIDHAISLYRSTLKNKDLYPTDIEAILLKDKLSLGTWICYFNAEGWEGEGLQTNDNNKDINGTKTPRSWLIFSLWNDTRDALNLQRKSFQQFPSRFFNANPNDVKDNMHLCLKMPVCNSSLEKPLGFLFIYGLHGEGDRLKELMKLAWEFASKIAGNVTDCTVIMTELGVSDPLREHVPRGPSMSCINDLWYIKKVSKSTDEEDKMGSVGNVFVDPRDF